jgi:sulfite reductase (NADPH) flavoprotein alpha-component
MMLTIDPVRWGSALALLVAAYGGLCAAMLRKARPVAAGGDDADWLVVYASQTGNAEYLAQQTAATLATGGLSARAVCISDLDAGALAGRRAPSSSPAPMAKAIRPTPPRASPA